MALVYTNGQMDANIKVRVLTVKSMDLASTLGKMAANMKAHIKKMQNMDMAFIHGQPKSSTGELGRMVNNMVSEFTPSRSKEKKRLNMHFGLVARDKEFLNWNMRMISRDH